MIYIHASDVKWNIVKNKNNASEYMYKAWVETEHDVTTNVSNVPIK